MTRTTILALNYTRLGLAFGFGLAAGYGAVDWATMEPTIRALYPTVFYSLTSHDAAVLLLMAAVAVLLWPELRKGMR
jgi:hypothetical protein